MNVKTGTAGGGAATAAWIDEYLRAKGSPLAGQGAAFVESGRRERVDPLLLVAIAGAESSFATAHLSGSHNPFGWGPGIDFTSFREAIAAVADGLRSGYLDKGRTTIEQLAGKYVGDSDPVGRGNWIRNVTRFYRELGGTSVAAGSSAAAPAAKLSDWLVTDGDADLARVNPSLLARLWLLGAYLGQKVTAISGFRSDEEQQRIYDSGVRPAATPIAYGGEGSNHTRGQAVDATLGGVALGDAVDETILADFGLKTLKSRDDPAHVEEAEKSPFDPNKSTELLASVGGIGAAAGRIAKTLGPKIRDALKKVLRKGGAAGSVATGIAAGRLATAGSLGAVLALLGIKGPTSVKWALLWFLLTLAGLALVALGVLRLVGIGPRSAIDVARREG